MRAPKGKNPKPQYNSTCGRALREGLRAKVLAAAVKNAKRRFSIPSTENYFGGIQYENAMIDNGCNSLLLPFPLTNLDALRKFEGADFSWEIAYSQGTGASFSYSSYQPNRWIASWGYCLG